MPADQNFAPDILTKQFYDWEMRGRGWKIWPDAVCLEPRFRPFPGHYLPTPILGVDDGRKPTFLSSLFDRLKSRGSRTLVASFPTEDDYEFDPLPFIYGSPLTEIHVSIPLELAVSRELAAQLLCQLASRQSPVTFELVGCGGTITLQFVCARSERAEDQVW